MEKRCKMKSVAFFNGVLLLLLYFLAGNAFAYEPDADIWHAYLIAAQKANTEGHLTRSEEFYFNALTEAHHYCKTESAHHSNDLTKEKEFLHLSSQELLEHAGSESHYRWEYACADEDHSKTGLQIIVLNYEAQRNFISAERLDKRLISVYSNLFGSESVEVGDRLNSLGYTYANSNHFLESEIKYKQAIVLYKKLHGQDLDLPKEYYLGTTYAELSELYKSRNRRLEAKKALVQASDSMESGIAVLQLMPQDDLNRKRLGALKDGLASIYRQQGRIKAAKALEIEVKKLKSD